MEVSRFLTVMQRRQFLNTSLAASALAISDAAALQAQGSASLAGREYYEIRRYQLQSGPQTKLTAKYLAEALIPALNRLGMKNIGAFDLYLGPQTPELYVVIPSSSLETLVTSELLLAKDDEYQKAGEEFLKAAAKEPAYQRIESSLSIAFEGYPKLTPPPGAAQHPGRIFQLRTYESPSTKAHRSKVEMFNSGEFDIFAKAGFWNVFFSDNLIGSRLPSLTYMVGLPNLTELDCKWAAFSADPNWKKLTADPRFNYEPIVSDISNLILKPTKYSQI
jgi:hypothetical protein